MVSLLAIPLIFMLGLMAMMAVMTLFGVAWLFHHHYLKPLFGGLLVGLGLMFLIFFAGFQHRAEMNPPATPVPTTARSADSADKTSGRATPAVTTQAEKSPTDEKPIDPTAKPSWVGQPPHTITESGVGAYVTTAVSGPYSTVAECERNLTPAVEQSVSDFMIDHLGEHGAKPVAIDSKFLQGLIRERYFEPVKLSIGDMFQLHALLVFDGRVQGELENRIRESLVNERLRYTAMGGMAVFVLLGGVYSALKASGGRQARG